ncbi:hypothetical protein V5O48_008626 [Marasmius crinis-equi]|uniref:Aminoglycoside phosphotransferase domain-containing protein n=1 Tax=Marasmius crinis-equi TaxID=585013 RepID=A0ABR3FDF8_9AGAR
MKVVLSDGTEVINRRVPKSDDDTWNERKFCGEIDIMRLLHFHESIPVPEVYFSGSTGDYSYMVIEKMQGVPLFNIFSTLPSSVKAGSTSNTKIGSLRGSAENLVVEPRTYIRRYSPTIIARTRTRRPTLNRNATWRDSELKYGPKPVVTRRNISAVDLDPCNILVDQESSVVTGIIDWEFNSVQPALLVAEYPSWLLYSGCFDPRFAGDTNWWFDGPRECAFHREMFEKVRSIIHFNFLATDMASKFVKAKDPEFHDCLVKGGLLRDAVGWPNSIVPDPGCARMAEWLDDSLQTNSKTPPT